MSNSSLHPHSSSILTLTQERELENSCVQKKYYEMEIRSTKKQGLFCLIHKEKFVSFIAFVLCYLGFFYERRIFCSSRTDFPVAEKKGIFDMLCQSQYHEESTFKNKKCTTNKRLAKTSTSQSSSFSLFLLVFRFEIRERSVNQSVFTQSSFRMKQRRRQLLGSSQF